MSFSARLEDLELSSLLHLIALNRNSGRLRLTRSDAHALLVFREGRVIYAATNAVRQTFGSILLLRGLINEEQLMIALERQHSFSEHRRLGQILIEMGAVDESSLREVMKEQTESVVSELMGWHKGFFKFEPMEVARGGEVEVDIKEFLVAEGFDTQELLLQAATRLDEASRDRLAGSQGLGRAPEPEAEPEEEPEESSPAPEAPGEEPRPLAAALGDHHPPAFAGETALKLMRYAAQIVNRGVLFIVRSHEVAGIGQFGIDIPGAVQTSAERVRATAIPRSEPSILRHVLDSRETYRGPLKRTGWNEYLIQQLGGEHPSEVVVVPMVMQNDVRILFYGDNLPGQERIGPIEGVEFMMAEAAREMDRAGRKEK
jgi:Domain of unknown function (DUF4388)